MLKDRNYFNSQVRDKKKDRARDDDMEEDIRPKQSSFDIPFMTVEEVRLFSLFCVSLCLACFTSFLIGIPLLS